jgi:hypothetical protein
MRAKQVIGILCVVGALAGCDDELVKAGDLSTPPTPKNGLQAFIQVDNEHASVGQQVRVWVRVQVGSELDEPLASYTGRLRFDPRALSFTRDVQIDDGLRVINSKGSDTGDIRFAGAQAGGFDDLTLYEGVFTVRQAGYVTGLSLEMEEMSGAELTDYDDAVEIDRTVYVRQAGN